MKKLKTILIFAVSGFLFSLLCGLISGTGALRMFGMAFLWCAIFGALGFGISVLFSSVLASDDGQEIGTEDAPVQAPRGNGQVVDITVDDDVLEDTGHDNSYLVGSSHQMLTQEDLGKKTSFSSEPAKTAAPKAGSGENAMAAAMAQENKAAATTKDTGNDGFVPIKNLETMYNVSGTEAQTPKQAASTDGVRNGDFAEESGLDVLPDVSELGFEESGSSEIDNGINNDSAFATSGSGVSRNKETPSFGNEELIAKAISSVLARDDS